MSSKNRPCNVGGTASPGLFTSTVTRAWAAPVLNGTADAASVKIIRRKVGFMVRIFICLLMRCGAVSFCRRHFHFPPADYRGQLLPKVFHRASRLKFCVSDSGFRIGPTAPISLDQGPNISA